VLEVRPKTKDRRAIRRRRASRRWWLLISLLVLAAVAGSVALYQADIFNRPKRGLEVVVAGRQLVQASLPRGLQVTFSPDAQTVVEAFPDGRARVTGWLETPGPEGKPERQNFTVVVFKDRAGKWASETITVVRAL